MILSFCQRQGNNKMYNQFSSNTLGLKNSLILFITLGDLRSHIFLLLVGFFNDNSTYPGLILTLRCLFFATVRNLATLLENDTSSLCFSLSIILAKTLCLLQDATLEKTLDHGRLDDELYKLELPTSPTFLLS